MLKIESEGINMNPNYINPFFPQVAQPMQQPNIPMAQPTNSIMQQPTNQFVKVVDSLETVRVTDVPMDGQLYYFPKADGSVVYGKRWLPDCTTQIIPYFANTEQNNVQGNKSTHNVSEVREEANKSEFDLNERMQAIESKIDNIEKMLSVKKSAPRTKKEVEEDA